MSKTYSAGIVTAYGAAKRAGYQGTYEDFCRQQAGYAGNAAAVEQAKTDAINAKNDAISAKNDAVSAKGDAVSAKNDAVSAKDTAVVKAQEASQSATSAGQSATSASQSATNASQSATSASQSAQNAEQSAQGVSGSLAQIATNTAEISQLSADLDAVEDKADFAQKFLNAFAVESEGGAIASFTDGADDIPLKSLVIDINPVQAGTGDPSPENVRPITGRTGMQLSTSGEDMSSPTVKSVSWQTEAGTVYGGTLDVLSGVLTVTMAGVDLETLNWAKENIVDKAIFRCGTFTDGTRVPLFRGYGMCSQYTWAQIAIVSTLPNMAVSVTNSMAAPILRIRDDSKIDLTPEEFKTAMSGVQVVYEIYEPIVYQLTPQEVSSLLGINNIWADTGDTNVEYRADTVLYADKVKRAQSEMIAPVETAYTATRNYTTGQLLIVDNTLYKVTSNIANGGTITPNTNVLATTLSEVIASLT